MLTPEQRAAWEATLREWRRHQPDQVPCHYCGTLVWLQHAQPVPDNPADPYDRYACAACGADGQGQKTTRDRGVSRHRARQIRARIVLLASEYREACAQHQDALARAMGPDVPTWLLREEERVWEVLQQARDALFYELGVLEMLEEGR